MTTKRTRYIFARAGDLDHIPMDSTAKVTKRTAVTSSWESAANASNPRETAFGRNRVSGEGVFMENSTNERARGCRYRSQESRRTGRGRNAIDARTAPERADQPSRRVERGKRVSTRAPATDVPSTVA